MQSLVILKTLVHIVTTVLQGLKEELSVKFRYEASSSIQLNFTN
jgi:hypothetical protein